MSISTKATIWSRSIFDRYWWGCVPLTWLIYESFNDNGATETSFCSNHDALSLKYRWQIQYNRGPFKTHWGRVTHICVSKVNIIGSDNGLSAPSHYLNHCWNIVNRTLRNKLQWNFNQNLYIFIQENAFDNVVCKIGAILSRRQWATKLRIKCSKTTKRLIFGISQKCPSICEMPPLFGTHTRTLSIPGVKKWISPVEKTCINSLRPGDTYMRQ